MHLRKDRVKLRQMLDRWVPRSMRFKTFIFACSLALAIFLFAQRPASAPQQAIIRKVIDLTHPLSEASPNWEGTAQSPFHAKRLGELQRNGYFSREITLPEHFSTHMDAPAHFAAGAWTTDQIPPERLVGMLVVIDVAAKAAKNDDYELSLDDIGAWEKQHGEIPPGAIVFARTGWSQRWGSMKEYRNADAKGVTHYPGFSLDAAKFLVEARTVTALGIDTMSCDFGKSDSYPVHQYTASKNIYQLENVANLDKVPASGAIVTVGVAKLKDGSGGPVRLLALIASPEKP